MNFPDQYYVGAEQRKAFDVNDPPLGFATPYGTNAAFKKRRETVDNWVGNVYDHVSKRNLFNNPYEGTVIDNVPLAMFTFEKSVSRYTTSNKLFRINDPRGFQLEISAENLADILLNCSTDHGEIIGQFVWGRDGSTNYLCRLDHPEYLAFKNPKKEKGKLDIGDLIKTQQQGELIYVGEMYGILLGSQSGYLVPDKDTPGHPLKLMSYHEAYQHLSSRHLPEETNFSTSQKDKTKWLVFQYPGGKKPYYDYVYFLARKALKYEHVSENASFTKPEKNEPYIIGTSKQDVRSAILFDTCEEMNAFEIDPVALKSHCFWTGRVSNYKGHKEL